MLPKGQKRSKKSAIQITDLRVDEVSAVDVPANGREFALMKRGAGPDGSPLSQVFLAGARPEETRPSLSPEQAAVIAKFTRQ